MRIWTLTTLLLPLLVFGQRPTTYKIRTVAFYNLENLFDTKNDSLIFDDDRTPKGSYKWTEERYKTKITNTSEVLSKIGKGTANQTPDLIGLCEIENKSVLRDLITHPNLVDENYGFVHFNSPDDRGIDVALLYKKATFLPNASKSHRLLLFDDEGNRDYTRDQLVVSGYLDDEEVHFIVNHWPSRRGGQTKSEPLRLKAAQLTKRIIDSLKTKKNAAKIIIMGDLNDDPINNSLKKVLKTKSKPKLVDSVSLYNPMEKLFKKGFGTLAYRDKWNLFDQILITPNFTNKSTSGFQFWKAGIHNPKYLQNSSGQYKGYPFRTYVGNSYQGGYSDHFPVYIYLIQQVAQ